VGRVGEHPAVHVAVLLEQLGHHGDLERRGAVAERGDLRPDVHAERLGREDRLGEFEPQLHATAPGGAHGWWYSSSWMPSGSRNTSVENGMGSVRSRTPECSMPSSSSLATQASRLSRSGTPKPMWSRPVRASSKGSPSLASWWCRPMTSPEAGSMRRTA